MNWIYRLVAFTWFYTIIIFFGQKFSLWFLPNFKEKEAFVLVNLVRVFALLSCTNGNVYLLFIIFCSSLSTAIHLHFPMNRVRLLGFKLFKSGEYCWLLRTCSPQSSQDALHRNDGLLPHNRYYFMYQIVCDHDLLVSVAQKVFNRLYVLQKRVVFKSLL